MQRRPRDSYIEGSYTGVSAFSSAPAPSTNALVAASVIGSALKANNNNPVGLNLPKVQGPKANKFVRAASITNDSSRRNSIVTRNLPDNYISISRANSINTANARNTSMTNSSMNKNRLSYQKSVPNLKGRRSISDFTNSIKTSQQKQIPVYYKNVPKTIKKYIPSANGLVAVEVPNPAYREPTQSYNKSYRRSISNINMSSPPSFSSSSNISRSQYHQQTNQLNQSKNSISKQKQPMRSISKNVKTQTKTLPNGTKLVSTTVEEYIDDNSDLAYDEEFDDAYDDFDDVHNRNIDMSATFDDDDQIVEDDEYIEYNEPIDERHVYKNSASQYISNPKNQQQILEEDDDDDDDVKEKSNQKDLDEINEAYEEEKEFEIPNGNIEQNIQKVEDITEDNMNEVIEKLESERKYEDDVKHVISENEEMERIERENAFKSIDQPVQDPVILEDLNSRQFSKDVLALNSNTPSSSIVVPISASNISNGIKHHGLLSHGLLQEPVTSISKDSEFDQFSDSELQPAVEQEDDGYEDVDDDEYVASNTHMQNDIEELPEIDEVNEPEDYEEEELEEDYVNDIDEDEDQIEDFSTRDLTINNEEEYSEEERLAAQRKLNELVKQKEQEILRAMINNGDINKDSILQSTSEPEVIENSKDNVDNIPIVEKPIPAIEKPIPAIEKPLSAFEKPIPAIEKPLSAIEKPNDHEVISEVPVIQAKEIVTEPEDVEKTVEIVKDPIQETNEIEDKALEELKEITQEPTGTESSPLKKEIENQEEQFGDAASVDSIPNNTLEEERQKFINKSIVSPTHSNLLKSITKTQTDTSTEASDAELVFHTLSKESSNEVPEIQPIMISNIDSTEKFYTPPLTPIDPLSKRNSYTSDKLDSPSDTLQQSVKSFRRSESPESSMIKTEIIKPVEVSSTNKSMAQHLRPIFGSASRPLNSRSANNSPKKMVTSSSTKSDFSNQNNESGKKSGVAVLNISDDFLNNGSDKDDEDNEDGEIFDDTQNQLANLEVPKREPSVQAKLDLAEKRKTLGPDAFSEDNLSTDTLENSGNQQEVFNDENVVRRKSVLKNASSNNRSSVSIPNNQNEASGAYLSLTTAQNTKLNAMGSSGYANNAPQNLRRQSVNAMDLPARSRSGSASGNVNNATVPTDYAPLAAAAKAAQRHSVQPGAMGYGIGSGLEKNDKISNRNSTTGYPSREPIRIGGVKAPNPKVEEAKKRILQNRPGQKRAKELYELAKTRPQVKTDQLVALDDSGMRRSSFEKVGDLPEDSQGNSKKTKMTSMSLRDIQAVNYDQYETKKINRGFKSRFQDDHSDTDLPLPPVQPISQTPITSNNNYTNASLDITQSPINVSTSAHIEAPQEKSKSSFKFKLSGLNRKKSRTGLTNNSAELDTSTPANISAPVNISSPVGHANNIPNHVNDSATNSETQRKTSFFSNLHVYPEEHSQNNAPRTESKFEKFFSEPHGPKRNISSASAATAATNETVIVNEEGGKKKRGFSFKKMFGER